MESMQNFKDVLGSLLQELCSRLGQLPLPTREWTRVIRKDANTTEFPTEERSDLSTLMIGIHKVIEQSLSLENLTEIIRDKPSLASKILVDAAGNPIQGDIRSQANWLWNGFLGGFLRTYLEEAQKLTWNEDIFNNLFHQLVADIKTDTITITQFSPLTNIQLTEQAMIITCTGPQKLDTKMGFLNS